MLMCMVSTTSFAHDIEVKNADGVTIYYKWIQVSQVPNLLVLNDKFQRND